MSLTHAPQVNKTHFLFYPDICRLETYVEREKEEERKERRILSERERERELAEKE